MKTIILAAVAAVVLASALSVQAAPRQSQAGFDGAKFFEDIASRSSQ